MVPPSTRLLGEGWELTVGDRPAEWQRGLLPKRWPPMWRPALVTAKVEEMAEKTQPKGIDPKTGKPYEPIEIPPLKRKDFEGAVKRVAKKAR